MLAHRLAERVERLDRGIPISHLEREPRGACYGRQLKACHASDVAINDGLAGAMTRSDDHTVAWKLSLIPLARTGSLGPGDRDGRDRRIALGKVEARSHESVRLGR